MTTTTSSSTTIKTATFFACDHIGKRIYGAAANFKKAETLDTPQYNALMVLMERHPSYSLDAIAPAVVKQSYKGLNFELMMDYVDFKGDEVQKAEFEEIVSSNATYPTIKSWFLDNFKVGFTVEKAKREIAEHKLGARKAKVRATVKAKVVKAAPAVVAMPAASNF